jgi:uncharacterized membrane protein YdfJ with MMPL/SSD domain
MPPNPNHPPRSETPPDVMLGTYSAVETAQNLREEPARAKAGESLKSYVTGQLAVVAQLDTNYQQEDVSAFINRVLSELRES